MRHMLSTTNRSSGFTIVEMLVVAPMIVLLLTGLIAIMINMVGDILLSNERGRLVATSQDALDRIEADVRLTSKFAVTTGTVSSPQGSNNSTAAFTNSSQRLVLAAFMTTNNPVDRANPVSLVYKANAPHSCTDPDPLKSYTYNEPFLGYIVYFVEGDSLWRRTIVPTGIATCGTAWQRNSCEASLVGQGSCVTRDERILTNLDSFNIGYFVRPSDDATVSIANAPVARTVEITIDTRNTVAGTPMVHSVSARATRLNTPIN